MPLPEFGEPYVLDPEAPAQQRAHFGALGCLIVSFGLEKAQFEDAKVLRLRDQCRSMLARVLASRPAPSALPEWTFVEGIDFFGLAFGPIHENCLIATIREISGALVTLVRDGSWPAGMPVDIYHTTLGSNFLLGLESATTLSEILHQQAVANLAVVVRLGPFADYANQPDHLRKAVDRMAALLEGSTSTIRSPVTRATGEVAWHRIDLATVDQRSGSPHELGGPDLPDFAGLASLLDIFRIADVIESPSAFSRGNIALTVSARSLELALLWEPLLARLRKSPDLAAGLMIQVDFGEDAQVSGIYGLVERLRNLGCCIGLAGFGFGSGPRQAYLLAPDVISIHPFFVLGSLTSSRTRERLTHMIGLACSFAHAVVLTGLRSEEQTQLAFQCSTAARSFGSQMREDRVLFERARIQ